MRNLWKSCTLHAAALLGLSFAGAGVASAQADATAIRPAELTAFGGITLANPDYGQKNNFGYSAGFEYNRTSPGVVAPGLELRMTGSSGGTVSERSVLGGMEFRSNPIHNIQPYMSALFGFGSINYSYSFTTRPSETDFVYGFGAGAEIPVRRNIKVRADYLQQTWHYQPHNLTPSALTIGVTYTIMGGYGGLIR